MHCINVISGYIPEGSERERGVKSVAAKHTLANRLHSALYIARMRRTLLRYNKEQLYYVNKVSLGNVLSLIGGLKILRYSSL